MHPVVLNQQIGLLPVDKAYDPYVDELSTTDKQS